MEASADFFLQALQSPSVPPSITSVIDLDTKAAIDLNSSTAQEDISKLGVQYSMRKAASASKNKTKFEFDASTAREETMRIKMQTPARKAPMGISSLKMDV